MTTATKSSFVLGHRHLLGIEGLSVADINGLLDLSEEFVELNRQVDKKRSNLRGRTQVNLFFEASTRTQSSFEIAGKRLGADVMNMSVASSSIRKGETLMDTAVTLNAMHPDILVVRHHASGAVELLAISAVLTLLIPLSSLAGLWNIGGAWSHPGSWPVDATALLAVLVLLYLARHTRRRMRQGHTDSVWSQ